MILTRRWRSWTTPRFKEEEQGLRKQLKSRDWARRWSMISRGPLPSSCGIYICKLIHIFHKIFQLVLGPLQGDRPPACISFLWLGEENSQTCQVAKGIMICKLFEEILQNTKANIICTDDIAVGWYYSSQLKILKCSTITTVTFGASGVYIYEGCRKLWEIQPYIYPP